MALGFAPKIHRKRAKAFKASAAGFHKALKKDAKKHNCKAALTHFANLSFYSGLLSAEKVAGKKGAKAFTTTDLKSRTKKLQRSVAGKMLNSGLADLRAACSISKRRVSKKKK